MLFIQKNRRDNGANESLYEMDHGICKDYRGSHNDFRWDYDNDAKGKINSELSMISCEQELVNELNRGSRYSNSRSISRGKNKGI